MWKLLLHHSKGCNDTDCTVPRCRDIKEYMVEKMKVAESCVVAGQQIRSRHLV
jgi:E1A/CREB-binding protein